MANNDDYVSEYSGARIDELLNKVDENSANGPDTTPTTGSQHLITSGGVKSALGGKADEADLTTLSETVGGIDERLAGVEGKIPSAASSDNQLADKAFVNDGLSDKASQGSVNAINAKIPTAASADNKLADKQFVNTGLAQKASASDVEAIQNKIPSAASPSNKLATASDVNAKYTKPGSGIPATDLAGGVQTSLGKADAALPAADVIDNLTTDNATKALSAKQGKVLDGKVSQLGQEAIYDVSARNGGATFASLSALLSSENLSTLIPIAVRCGGMSIRFVQSSDNKYVQSRLMTNTWSTNEANWQGVDTEITEGSHNLAESGAVKIFVDSLDVLNREGEKDAFYVADKRGNVVAKFDSNGLTVIDVKVKENNAFVSLLTKISTLGVQVGTIEGQVEALDGNVVLKNSNDENIVKEESDEFIIMDARGYVAFEIDKYGNIKSTQKNGKDIKNDLVRQNVITPVVGTYGQNNAVYKLSNLPKTFRLAFDFTVNDNLNVTGTDLPFLTIVGAATKQVKTLHAVPTDLNVSRNGETYTAVSQVIGFNSGFNVCGTSVVRTPSTKRPIVGDTVFAMWLKGNFDEESDFPTAQEVSDRATWLGQHTSSQIVFTGDTFTVQGVASSDISVSIKNGSAYKTLGDFYDDLVEALGDYFDFKKMRLTASKTTEDLLQFGTLKLVSNYWQQTNKSSNTLSYNYDSYPVSVPLAVDESLHTAEVVYTGNTVYVSIDGDFVSYGDTGVTDIYVGGTSLASGLVTCKNLEYNLDSLGDALVSGTYGIVSARSPRVIGVMQHLIEDKYEGETLTQSYYSSVSRMLDEFRILENKGYTILTLNDVCLWLSGRKKVPARSVFYLATTTPTYDNFLNDMISRRIWTSASVPLILGSSIENDIDAAQSVDDMFKQVVSARAIGVDYITHLYDHDVIPDYKNSLILQQEIYKLIRRCIDCGVDTRMYSWGWSCESVNYFNMLSLNGFIGAMGGGDYTNNSTTQYQIGRINIADNMSFNTLNNILI